MARKTRIQRKLEEELLSENLPMDLLPYSNGEHFPEAPQAWQIQTMKLADEMCEKVRRKYGMSRREFVRTSAAFTVCLWALNQVTGSKYGSYAWGATGAPYASDDPRWDACDLDNPSVQLANAPGEFVFDVQSHHVVSDAKWRVLQPVHYAFICGLFGETNTGNKKAHPQGVDQGKLMSGDPNAVGTGNSFVDRTNLDTCQNVGRWAYMKDIYMDSATTAGVLSPVPSAPDEQQPLPFAEADKTANMINNLSNQAGKPNALRCVTHGYVMPNRGWAREQNVGSVPNPVSNVTGPSSYGQTLATTPNTGKPAFLDDELDWMEQRAVQFRKNLRGWKVYTPYGDVPFSSGMAHDSPTGFAMNDQIRKLNAKYGVPLVLASHKGVWLPTFDDRRQACDDVPLAAIAYPDIRFVIYHSAGGGSNFYPTDQAQDDSTIPIDDYRQGTNGLLRNLKIHSWDALSHIPKGLAHGNSPNVHVDLGSVQPSSAHDGSIFYGKLVKHLGAQRICWGTDSLWGGSPHAAIVRVRTLNMEQASRDLYNLTYGLDGDRYDPRVNALSGTDYNPAYAATLQSNLSDASWQQPWMAHHRDAILNWPTDGKPHPERSIRNGILGRNAAAAYEVDADEQRAALSCDDVNRLREEYLQDTVLGKAAPARSNEIYGPRNRQQLIGMLNEDWKNNGWRA